MSNNEMFYHIMSNYFIGDDSNSLDEISNCLNDIIGIIISYNIESDVIKIKSYNHYNHQSIILGFDSPGNVLNYLYYLFAQSLYFLDTSIENKLALNLFDNEYFTKLIEVCKKENILFNLLKEEF
mgnify:CR=1 FL=1